MTRAVVLSSLLACSALAAEPAPAKDSKEKPRVAVLYFDISSTDPEHQVLKKGIAELMISDLTSDPGLVVVERLRLEEVITELNLQTTNKVDQSTAVQIGKLLGAQYLVMGSITSISAGSFITARVISVDQAKSVATSRQSFKPGEIFDAEQKVAADLSKGLAAMLEHPAPAKKKLGSLTMENAVKYSQALDHLDKKDKKAAKEKLEAVVKAQPDFMLASLELDRLMK